VPQDHGLDRALDRELITLAAPALDDGTPVHIERPIHNTNRTVGTMLGHEVTRRWGGDGLPEGTIDVHLRGSAGQSFGAFVPRGVTLRLEGDANDYLAKGLSGGRVIVHPDREAPFAAEHNVIAGNVIAYGATAGELFIRGLVGERFCVRNSGVTAVVEGVGDHGCEYMTGGRVLVLGPTGRNFGAGMSGGIAYVYDPDRVFETLVNREMVDVEALTDDDRESVRALVARHGELTGSVVAAQILESWVFEVSAFRKVMPRDYRRVLAVLEAAEADGLAEDETLGRVMAAAHG
jgi:glutamate synthase (NADPH/NADH) large chain